MKVFRFFRSVFLLALFMLSACSHEMPFVSQRHELAVSYNQRAQRAYQRGEYETASGLYEHALRLDSAIENVEGIALNTLNLAKVNRALGKSDVAQLYLDRLLHDRALTYPVEQMSAAAAQYGLLRLQAGDIAAANTWAEQAVAYCGSQCNQGGVIANLRANIAVQANDAERAWYWSARALSANKAEGGIEYANALRLAAQSRLLKLEAGEAVPLLEEALGIDKKQGLPEKIRMDLLLLAQAQEALGRADLAAPLRERAVRITASLTK